MSQTPQTVTVNLDQLENQAMKGIAKTCETYRMIIDAQGKQIKDLEAQLAAAKAPKPGKKAG